MNFHIEGQIVEIVVPLTDEAGNPVTPSGITATLHDGEDQLIADLGAIGFLPDQDFVTITLIGALNQLDGDALKEARVLTVEIAGAGGSLTRKTHIYGIEHERSLQAPQNSFQSLAGALLLASDLVNVKTFLAASEARQKAALVESFWRIARLPLVYQPLDLDGELLPEMRIGGSAWSAMSPEDFKALPSTFRRALAQAQIIEADELLSGNAMARKHAQGIVSETIGESSVTLRQGGQSRMNGGLCHSATVILAPWIDDTIRVARA